MESYSMDPMEKNPSSQNHSDSNNPKVKRKGPRRIIYRFFHYTTINGLQRLASARSILGRLFWVAVMLGATAMFSRDIYNLFKQYYERPVSVVSRVEYFRAMRFPAITVCNVNPIRKSSYEFSPELKAKLDERDNGTCFRKADRETNILCQEDKDEIEEFDNEIDHILSSIDEKELRESGHQLDDFIVSCRFNGIRCRNKKYWTQIWDPQYGNCYTFNSRLAAQNKNKTVSAPFRTTKPGSAYGLKLAFNIELHEYIPQLTADAGIKVSIGEPGEMPFPIYNSLSLAPGFHSEIAIKRIQITRIDRFNNGSCREDRLLGARNPYQIRYGAKYSVQACLQYCYSRSQISKCGCAEYSYFGATPKGKICDETNDTAAKARRKRVLFIDLMTNVTRCDVRCSGVALKYMQDECLDSWKDTDGDCEKLCHDPCQETIYESSLTFTQWPYMGSVSGVLDSLGFDYKEYDNSIDRVRSNFLAANIFFQRFRETQIEESFSYETANLLADIGGQIGLWAGLSVISMCELLELFALLCRYFLQRERQ